jgi:opacity protein-like surface antigen
MNRQRAPGAFSTLFRAVLMAALLLLASPAAATTIFFDDFNSEPGSGAGGSGQSELNYSGFANWTVSSGTVDLIFHDDFAPAAGEIECIGFTGKCVDLDGGTNNAGLMTSVSILLAPGLYELSFELAGVASSFGQAAASVPNIVDFNVTGTTLVGQATRNQGDPYGSVGGQFTLLAPTSVQIVIANQGGDNFGAMLDDVHLELIPEPNTFALLAGGLLVLALGRRRRS